MSVFSNRMEMINIDNQWMLITSIQYSHINKHVHKIIKKYLRKYNTPPTKQRVMNEILSLKTDKEFMEITNIRRVDATPTATLHVTEIITHLTLEHTNKIVDWVEQRTEHVG